MTVAEPKGYVRGKGGPGAQLAAPPRLRDWNIDPMTRVAGALAVHTVLDLENRRAVDAHARAMLFRGYEVILEGRDPRDAIDISSRACGVVWNVKVHRVGGLTEVCRIYRVAEWFGAELWAGTMPESGIGSQAALAAAGFPRFTFPSDLEPSTRWFGRDVDVIKLVMGRDGRMAVPRLSAARLLDADRFRRATRRIR